MDTKVLTNRPEQLPGRTIQKASKSTNNRPGHNPMIPHTPVLKPRLVIGASRFRMLQAERALTRLGLRLGNRLSTQLRYSRVASVTPRA